MILKIKIVNPKLYKKDKTIKCRDCSMEYTFLDYFILNERKKLCYFTIHDDVKNFYCHDCCTKRILLLQSQIKNITVMLIDGSTEKKVDLD